MITQRRAEQVADLFYQYLDGVTNGAPSYDYIVRLLMSDQGGFNGAHSLEKFLWDNVGGTESSQFFSEASRIVLQGIEELHDEINSSLQRSGLINDLVNAMGSSPDHGQMAVLADAIDETWDTPFPPLLEGLRRGDSWWYRNLLERMGKSLNTQMKSLMLRFDRKSMNEEGIKQRIADAYTTACDGLLARISAFSHSPMTHVYRMEHFPLEGDSYIAKYGLTSDIIQRMSDSIYGIGNAYMEDIFRREYQDEVNAERFEEIIFNVASKFQMEAQPILDQWMRSGGKSLQFGRKSLEFPEQQARETIAQVFGRISEQLGRQFARIVKPIGNYSYDSSHIQERRALNMFQRGGLSPVVLDQMEEMFALLEGDAIAYVMRHEAEDMVSAQAIEDATVEHQRLFRMTADKVMQEYLDP